MMPMHVKMAHIILNQVVRVKVHVYSVHQENTVVVKGCHSLVVDVLQVITV